ncbi:MAG: NADH-quinone oxidoreductase subunit N [bacterium]|nr:NADH-quinone oxidoreductase subunit N [bacterium]
MFALTDLHLEGFRLLSPEITLVTVSLVILVMDLLGRGRNMTAIALVSLGGLALTAFQLVAAFNDQPATAFGLVAVDKFGNFFKLFTCGALAVVIFFVMSDRREKSTHIGEYYFLLLGAGIGIFFMVGTNNLLLLVLGLELLSLSSYSLAGFHKGEKRSAEAAMKYIVFGGLSAGVMVYGVSLLYGLTGTLNLKVMAGVAGAVGEGHTVSLAAAVTDSPGAVAAAMVLILGGFSYKISVAPFHFWAPDVYEGAPTPVTTFLAVASKAAGFGALLRFIGVLFMSPGTQEAVAAYGLQVGQLVAVLAAVTMTIGNLAALRQESVKRMLAYSSVAHAGYILVGVVAMDKAGFDAAMLYLAAYYFMNLGAFGFLLYFHGVTGKETFESLNGMGYRAPLISISMVVFLISLTGLPPSVGFYGKMTLIYAAWDKGINWLIICLLINSVISLFYYVRVAKHLFLMKPSEETAQPQPAMTGFLVAMAGLTVVFGLWATPLLEWTSSSMDLLAAR